MQVRYGEDLARHDDPESCVSGREAVGKVLTGEHAARAMSREKFSSQAPTKSHRAIRATTLPTILSMVVAAESTLPISWISPSASFRPVELNVLELGDAGIGEDLQVRILLLLLGTGAHHLDLPLIGRERAPQRLELCQGLVLEVGDVVSHVGSSRYGADAGCVTTPSMSVQ